MGVSSRRSCRTSQNLSASASAALLVGAQTWITVILNSMNRDHSVVFDVDHDGYSISSKGFLPTVVDISHLVKFTHSGPF